MKPTENKAQASLEFIIVMSVMLLVFAIMGSVIYHKYVELSDLRLYITGRHIANTLADNINQINTVGEGYSQQFTLYTRYPGDEFNITIPDTEALIIVENQMTWHAPLLTAEISCCLPDLCEDAGNRTIMRLNSTLTTKIIYYNKSIHIGSGCL